MARHSTIF